MGRVSGQGWCMKSRMSVVARRSWRCGLLGPLLASCLCGVDRGACRGTRHRSARPLVEEVRRPLDEAALTALERGEHLVLPVTPALAAVHLRAARPPAARRRAQLDDRLASPPRSAAVPALPRVALGQAALQLDALLRLGGAEVDEAAAARAPADQRLRVDVPPSLVRHARVVRPRAVTFRPRADVRQPPRRACLPLRHRRAGIRFARNDGGRPRPAACLRRATHICRAPSAPRRRAP